VIAGVAAAHPTTVRVGIEVLQKGGSAADAAVAGMLASCATESIFTGLGGGGFVTHYEAGAGAVTCLDFFCVAPGLDRDVRAEAMQRVHITYGQVPMDYRVGGASVAVPGVPSGAAEIHRRWGRLPWPDVVSPAIEVARAGSQVPAEHARVLQAIAPALVTSDGEEIYAPDGRLLDDGDRLVHPGLDVALSALADEGADVFYSGWVGQAMIRAVRQQGGCLGPADLRAYRTRQTATVHTGFAGRTVVGRPDLNRMLQTMATLPEDFHRLTTTQRAAALARSLASVGRETMGDTTNISVVDPEGDACVITTSLGMGSGVWIPELGVHLNSMLGEGELLINEFGPGERMLSMMCPIVVLDRDGGLELAAGAAGASRIRTALIQLLTRTLIEKESTARAIDAPRFHVVRTGEEQPTVHVEPDLSAERLRGLVDTGYDVRVWDERSVYFGGVSAVGRSGAAGDPRRGGAAEQLD
jgi:gamma-glutamyltranspeptidase / glutathione hydrolase